MIDIEHLSDAELDVLAHRYEVIRAQATQRRVATESDQKAS
jgi:hypothetical protein